MWEGPAEHVQDLVFQCRDMVTILKCSPDHLLRFLEKLPVSERRETQVCQCVVMTMTKEHASCPARKVTGQLCCRKSDSLLPTTEKVLFAKYFWLGFQTHSRTRFSNFPLGM